MILNQLTQQSIHQSIQFIHRSSSINSILSILSV